VAFLRGEYRRLSGDWKRNPFQIVNETHQQNMQEIKYEMPVAALDPTGITMTVVLVKSVVKRVKRWIKWIKN